MDITDSFCTNIALCTQLNSQYLCESDYSTRHLICQKYVTHLDWNRAAHGLSENQEPHHKVIRCLAFMILAIVISSWPARVMKSCMRCLIAFPIVCINI